MPKKKKHPLDGKAIKIYTATPAYDGKVDADFAIALAESTQFAIANGVKVECAVMGNGAFIELARNMFVDMFLKTDCTHLFFIDADLRWEPRAFLGLVLSGREVCAGVYPKREKPESYPVRYVEAEEGGLNLVDGGWVECERVPTGFLCIRRDVVEAMVEKAPKWFVQGYGNVPRMFYTKQVSRDHKATETDALDFVGEDFAWSDDYREQFGKPICVWPDFDFTHGGHQGNWHTFLNKVAEEEMARRGITDDDSERSDPPVLQIGEHCPSGDSGECGGVQLRA